MKALDEAREALRRAFREQDAAEEAGDTAQLERCILESQRAFADLQKAISEARREGTYSTISPQTERR